MTPIKTSLSLLGIILALFRCNITMPAETNQKNQHRVARVRIDGQQVAEIGWEKIRVEHDFGAPQQTIYKDTWIKIYLELLDELRGSRRRIWSVHWITRFGDTQYTEPTKLPHGFQAVLCNGDALGLALVLPRPQGSQLVFYVVKLNEVKEDPLPPKPGSYDKFAIHYTFPVWRNFTTIPEHRLPLEEKLAAVLGAETTRQLLREHEIETVALRCMDMKWTLVAKCGPYTLELCAPTENPRDWRLQKLTRKPD